MNQPLRSDRFQPSSWSGLFPWFWGAGLIAASILLNETAIARFCTEDGAIASPSDLWLIHLFQIVLALAGVFFIFLRNKTRLRRFAVNLTLSLAVCLLLIPVLEVGVFRMNAHRIPMRFHGFFLPFTYTFTQSSKQGVMPRNYIAIVGDSYAMGDGDWRITANPWTNPPFCSQHVLHDRLKRDVVNLGIGGGDCLRYTAIRPVAQFKFLQSTLLYRIEAPKIILVYFYEGGLHRTINTLKLFYEGRYDMNRIYDPVYFRAFLDDMVKQKIPRGLNQWILPRFVKGLVSGLFLRLTALKKTEDPEALALQKISSQYAELSYSRYEKEAQEKIPDSAAIRAAVQGLSRPEAGSPESKSQQEMLRLSLYVFEQSLVYLKSHFPETEFFVVHIPDISASYEAMAENETASEDHRQREPLHQDAAFAWSDMIGARIQEITARTNIQSIDSRPAIRAASRNARVHGTIDGSHFNQRGYTALAEAILPYLQKK